MASKRLRRRGPRSLVSLERRCKDNRQNGCRQPQGGGLCKPRLSPPSPDSFTIVHLNIHGFVSHRIELEVRLHMLGYPPLVGLTETFLDKSAKSLELHGYTLVSRLDRRNGQHCGGIALFARSDVAESIVHVGDSDLHERSWHMLHSDLGPILLGLWYRRPAYGEVASIKALDDEIKQHATTAIGIMLIGDFNVHHKSWLKYSHSTTPEGRELFGKCCLYGLAECVRQPTRGQYLLDLVLTDLEDAVSCEVLPGLSDHCVVLSRLSTPILRTKPITRECFFYLQADWTGLDRALDATDWASLLGERDNDPDAATSILTTMILKLAKRFIPFRRVCTDRRTVPWLNEKCIELVADKCAAQGKHDYFLKQKKCSQGLWHEYSKYITRSKEKLAHLPSSSKKWWALARSLTMKSTSLSSIPPLKCSSGDWLTDATCKANLFATCFTEKSIMPIGVVNEYTPTPNRDTIMSGFMPLRKRLAAKTLRQLREDSGTGPDGLPARLLKRCWRSLALPVTILARIILKTGIWPQHWRYHWIFPIFKRRAKSNAANYRGVHLTAQLSKVVERMIGHLFQPYFESTGAYGPNQFAYRKKRGYRDLLALNVMHWISSFNAGKRVALYCSDVAGAFDRVSAERLAAKLEAKGIHPRLLRLLRSWLGERKSVVVVDGASSDVVTLANSVYQGTVWGPPLWNIFYEDARHAVNEHDFIEAIFADDLNGFRAFEPETTDNDILSKLQECQRSLHSWGTANQVMFDPGKESFHILHPRKPYGDNFKMLGVTFDPKLMMDSAACEVAAEAGWRMRALLRCRRFYSKAELVRMYKAQVLSYIESSTPAIYHAPQFYLAPVDNIQQLFLNELEISSAEALLDYNLAPLTSRRDISMMGLLHRIVLGDAPEQFNKYIRLQSAAAYPRGWAFRIPRHNCQLFDPVDGTHSRIMERSVFGLIHSYNMLPQRVVDAKTVSEFQSRLQRGLKWTAMNNLPAWETVLRAGVKTLGVSAFQACFALKEQ